MQLRTVVLALMGMAVAEASVLRASPKFDLLTSRQNFKGFASNGKGSSNSAAKASATAASSNNNNNNGNNNAQLCLSSNAVQTGSAQDGSSGASAGQANSKTDDANFINFCSGKTLTNGIQQKGGSCNGIVMGDMPSSSNMVSTIITSPVPGKEPAANQDFNVVVQMANMELGTFTNPDSTYYAAPQQLTSGGDVIGHTHITIQDLGNSLTPSSALDASKFAFFKGINDAGNGKGQVQAAVAGGLPAGNYRICTMAGSSNHQPVLMPVAQRGAQDDCVRITIGNSGSGNSASNSQSSSNAKSSAQASQSSQNNPSGANPGAQSSSPSTASSPSQGSTGKTGKAGQNQSGQGSNKGSQGATLTPPNPAASKAATGSTKGAAGSNASSNNNNNNKPASPSSASPSSLPSSSSSSSSSSKGSGNANSGSKASSSSSSSSSQQQQQQSSSNAIGGIAAPAVADSGDSTRPFSVNGNTFVNKAAAVQRACAIQNNACADAVNSGKVTGSTVGDCNAQESACNQQGGA